MAEGKPNKPLQFKLRIDIQCGICGSLTHLPGDSARLQEAAKGGKSQTSAGLPLPKFCACCGAAMERFCLHCHKRAEMFFEEWWPDDDECLRTYSPAKRCGGCNAILEPEGGSHEHYQN